MMDQADRATALLDRATIWGGWGGASGFRRRAGPRGDVPEPPKARKKLHTRSRNKAARKARRINRR
jgi:hypothetical protein